MSLLEAFISFQTGGRRRSDEPMVSISLQFEADGYPSSEKILNSSGIKSSLYHINPEEDRHITLASILVPLSAILEEVDLTYNRRRLSLEDIMEDPDELTEEDEYLLVWIITKLMEKETSNFVLKTIKPVIDRSRKIELEFTGIELWPSGHLVITFDDSNLTIKRIGQLSREFLKRLFPNGKLGRSRFTPHITLGKYDLDEQKKLTNKLKQPDYSLGKPYRIISKRWFIYPSVRVYF